MGCLANKAAANGFKSEYCFFFFFIYLDLKVRRRLWLSQNGSEKMNGSRSGIRFFKNYVFLSEIGLGFGFLPIPNEMRDNHKERLYGRQGFPKTGRHRWIVFVIIMLGCCRLIKLRAS